MIIYVNGDSHTAAAEAVNNHAFAEDDGRYNYLGRLPHPDNLSVSWGKVLSRMIKAGFKCDAESAASNDRIIRTTRAWLKNNYTSLSNTLVIVQWSTWERQEWLIDGVYYQINASGIDHVPESHHAQYRDFVMTVDWKSAAEQAHDTIWQFHQELAALGVPHIFFNGNSCFDHIDPDDRLDWGVNYIEPYNTQSTYNQWLINNGHTTVSPNSWHFGQSAHAAWAKFVLQYIVKHQMV